MHRKPPTIVLPDVFVRIYEQKWLFLVTFLGVFFLSFVGLSGLGIAPSAFTFRDLMPGPAPIVIGPADDSIIVRSGEGELPVRIEIPAVGIEATVSNPNTTDVAALDRELLAGAVRYPGTGVLGEKGNVLMFGHSSHLPIVHNQAYKAFNDIQNLREGDPIFVFSEDKMYTYAVESVKEENTTTGAIALATDGAKLTLATCDNFGSKSDRFVVTATLVSIEDQN